VCQGFGVVIDLRFNLYCMNVVMKAHPEIVPQLVGRISWVRHDVLIEALKGMG
jgi:hypothetical protein